MNKKLTEQQRDELSKRQKDKENQLSLDKQKLMRMPEFQRVMSDIISRGGMFRSIMTGNSQTYYLSGKQDFAREIWAGLAEVDQDLAFKILQPKFGEELYD